MKPQWQKDLGNDDVVLSTDNDEALPERTVASLKEGHLDLRRERWRDDTWIAWSTACMYLEPQETDRLRKFLCEKQ